MMRGLVIFLLITTMVSIRVESIRVMKEKDYQSLLQNQLPRGPVPPSDPSPCHNKLDPFNQSDFSFHQDYIICP